MKKHLGYIELILIALFIPVVSQSIAKIVSKEEPISSLEVALQSAGNSRIELEKVLRHYKENSSDSFKYKAVCFLIENMPFYAYSDGEQLENYKSYYTCLKKNQKTPQQVADSVKEVYGAMKELDKKRDILEIDSAYLCHNIDWAFKVWQEQPWGKNISFETFCEYLLPYRIGDEPLTYWRETYYEKYNSLLDSLRMSDSLDIEDPVVAANYLISKLPDKSYYYTSVTPYPFGHIGPEYVQYLSGTCREVTDFGVYLFRALGIPCAIDFVPVRSYVNAGHFWLTTWNKDGEEYMTDFPQKLRAVRKENWWYRRDDSPKVYRYTFSANRNLYEQMAKYGEEVYPFWHLPKFTDVTHEYGYNFKKELVIPLEKQYKTKRDGKIAYLCISDRDRWTPVDWTEYDASRLSFQYVRNGSFMRVATYENGALCFLTDPFYVDKQSNEICYYPAGKEKEDVVLYAKCDIGRENMFRDRMIGGVFEGSNHPDFSRKDTLFIIQGRPNRLNTTVKSWSDKEYRYLRYFGPPRSACNISEVAFYEKDDTIALSGKIIGTPGCYQHDGTHEYTNVFDGKTWTSFDYFEATGGWAGLDLGRKVRVDRIVYTPRNRDNYVRPDDVYELFYCDRDWKSAGRIKAIADSLVFRDIPVNTVLLLRNHTRGLDERIFIYENGTQLWK